MFIKYFVSPTFRREDFASLCREARIPAAVVEDGIILNDSYFRYSQAGHMPVWLYLCKGDILSPLHTRPATQAEADIAYIWRYQLRTVTSYGEVTVWNEGDEISPLMEEMENIASEYRGMWSAPDLILLDRETGEIIREA